MKFNEVLLNKSNIKTQGKHYDNIAICIYYKSSYQTLSLKIYNCFI